jgi:methylase of polypeptide subunit release factors
VTTGRQRKTKAVTEFGDFQTPSTLARPAMELLKRLRVMPSSILEPTCGRGSFVAAAATAFPEATTILGVDINAEYLEAAAALLGSESRVELVRGDFFKLDWKSFIASGKAPWLIVGNPPWVTNAQLSAIESDNVPQKVNFQGRPGIEAITGKSNFDISEWMLLLRYLEWLQGEVGTIAVLCKTAVARKLLLHAWKKRASLHTARIYKIDALSHFGAAVEACFFVLEIRPEASSTRCDVFDNFSDESPSYSLAYFDGHLVQDVTAFSRHRGLLG